MPGRARDPIDELVGRNIRVLRLSRNMAQTALADQLGVTFQQVQKYEKGTNRIGAGRLLKIAAVFDVPVGALYAGADHQPANDAGRSPAALLAEPYALRLAQAFSAIENKSIRVSLVEITERIAVRRSEKAAIQGRNQPRARDLHPSHPA